MVYGLPAQGWAGPRSGSAGRSLLSLGDQNIDKPVKPTGAGKSPKADLGTVTLPTSEYELTITPLEIHGGELMKLYDVALTPAH